MSALWTVLILLGLGTATMQASTILLNGSIFRSLRDGIEARKKAWVYGKLHELFSCRLCMSTQVGIWMVATLEAAGLVIYGKERIFGTASVLAALAIFALSSFVLGLVVSRIAIGVWNFTEFSPGKFDALRRSYDQKMAELCAAMTGSNGEMSFAGMPFEEFSRLLARIDRQCDSYGCPMARRDCRVNTVERLAVEWWRRSGNPPGAFPMFSLYLQEATRSFYRSRVPDPAMAYSNLGMFAVKSEKRTA